MKLSAGDKISIFIASVALCSAVFTTYIQFLHKTSDLRFGRVGLLPGESDSGKRLELPLLLMNTGTNPVAIAEWFTFLSADGRSTGHACYHDNINPDNTAIYTYGCGSMINEILEPGMIEFIDLSLEISDGMLARYLELNTVEGSDEVPSVKVGLEMIFIDSNGKYAFKELIVGTVQWAPDGTVTSSVPIDPKELVIF